MTTGQLAQICTPNEGRRPLPFGPDTNLPRLTNWVMQAGFDFNEVAS